MMQQACFDSQRPGHGGWQSRFAGPRTVFTAHTVADVPRVLLYAERAARDGAWVALYVAYEAAPAFDPAFATHAPEVLPLACAAVFDAPLPRASPTSAYSLSAWKPGVSRDEHAAAITAIRNYIAAGDVYQVNYTFPLSCNFSGEAEAWYRDLCMAQQAAFCAFIDMGRFKILSLSPELFLERRSAVLTMRPMKGTAPRGRWSDEDAARAAWLGSSAKNRAENIMIVDLVRNDLGRVADIGSVSTPRQFDVERYPTVWQMTSTVQAQQRTGTTLADVFAAVFPCGSITGAPKIRAMEIIRELEPQPRGIYTGAIGLIEPGGDCRFNVAIRTVLVDTATGNATFGVGGGITWDSVAGDEYAECLDKCKFLAPRTAPFSLLESLLLESGEWFLLDRHIQRLKASADFFGFAIDEPRVQERLRTVQSAHQSGNWKVRLLADANGMVVAHADHLASLQLPRRITFATAPVRSDDVFLFHKTTQRAAYDEAMRSCPGFDDVILWNEQGDVTESTIANIVVEKDGNQWTPPRTSGLLAGVFRDELLARGEIIERQLTKDDVRTADRVFLINSVRRWMPTTLVNI